MIKIFQTAGNDSKQSIDTSLACESDISYEHDYELCPGGKLAIRFGNELHTVREIKIYGISYDHQTICKLLQSYALSVRENDTHLHFTAGDDQLFVSNEDAQRIKQALLNPDMNRFGVYITDVHYRVKLTGMAAMLCPSEGECDLSFYPPTVSSPSIAQASIPPH